MAVERLYFLSYSRQRLLYAESFRVHFMRESGSIRLWFDLAEIQPGADWQATIQEGLAASAGVILLASRPALESPYVELEWQYALAHAKPLFVVMMEWVRLPNALVKDAQAIIEGIYDFDRMLAQLRQSIWDGIKYRDPRTRLGWFGLPIQMPIEVWHISNIFLLSAIFFAGAAYYIPLLFVMSLIFLVLWVQWMRHHIAYRLFYVLPRILLVVHLVALFILYFAYDIGSDRDEDVLPILLLGILSGALLAYAQAFYRTPTNPERFVESGSILRWLPSTGATAEQRRDLNLPPSQRQEFAVVDPEELARMARMVEAIQKNLVAETKLRDTFPAPRQRSVAIHPKKQVDKTRHFRITAHPKDRTLAGFISNYLKQRGAVPVESEADYELILISRATDVNQVVPVLAGSGIIIPVLIESKPAPAVLDLISRWQMVDYRAQDPATLERLRGALFNVRVETTYDLTPQSFDKDVRRRYTPPVLIQHSSNRRATLLNDPPRWLIILGLAVCVGCFLFVMFMWATTPSSPDSPSPPALSAIEVRQTLEAVRRNLNPP